MRKHVSNEVVCPFYKYEEDSVLICEGFAPVCDLHVTFRGSRSKCNHKELHCDSFKGYPKCPLYPLINGQYE